MSRSQWAATFAYVLAATVLIVVAIRDGRRDRNPSVDRLRATAAVKWESLPFDWALLIKHGNGRRRIAVFSDPNCPYCRRLEGDLAKLGDVTIHLFLYPIIGAQSMRQTKSVWCSSDRARAWMDLMFKGIEPLASPDCDTPIEDIVSLGHKLGANATPTWILPNGEIRYGTLRIDELRKLLELTAPVATDTKQ